MATRLSEIERNEIVRLYQRGLSTRKVARVFDVDKATVCNVLKARGIPRRPAVASHIHTVNKNYFTVIDTEAKSYWLGFLYADGGVIEKPLTIVLELAIKDENHIRKFAKAVGSTYAISLTSGGQAVRTSIYNRRFVENLIKHGCTPQKSLTLKFPTTVPHHLLRHFIRGYFDGNGCLSINKCGRWQWYLSSASWEFLEATQKVLVRECGANQTKIGQNHNAWQLQYSGHCQIEHILDWLYADSTTETRLDRKYQLYLKFKQERKRVATA